MQHPRPSTIACASYAVLGYIIVFVWQTTKG